MRDDELQVGPRTTLFTHLASFKTLRAAREWAARAVRRNDIVSHTLVWIFQMRKGGNWLVDGAIWSNRLVSGDEISNLEEKTGRLRRPSHPTRILIAGDGPRKKRPKRKPHRQKLADSKRDR